MATQNTATDVAKIEKTENGVIVVDLNGKLPDLSKVDAFPFDLMSSYWTPEAAGESKRVFFDKIGLQHVKAFNSDEVIELECANFIESVGGEVKTIANGSVKLIGALVNNNIQRGTPLQITYLGKKKTKGGNMCDNWSIKLLQISI